MQDNTIQPIVFADDCIRILDQTLLPDRVTYIVCSELETVARAIERLSIRGAPAIGVAAAMAVALEMSKKSCKKPDDRSEMLQACCSLLLQTRPTAVNLRWSLERMKAVAEAHYDDEAGAFNDALKREALAIHQEEIQRNEAIGEFGQEIVPDPAVILTVCNTGSLAAPGKGTALGIVRTAFAAGKDVRVVVCETRPLLQGARLTTWELSRDGIPFLLITDSMAAHYMKVRGVDLVIAGADRIAANGDTANKIGTYALAVLAKMHSVPFFIAAPVSTIDTSIPDGTCIPIEERSCEEVLCIRNERIAPAGITVWNPAFDVVPNDYISGIITDKGVLAPPYDETIATL